MIEIITISFAIATTLAALWSAIFIQGRYNPNMDLRVIPVWSSAPKNILKLILEVENLGFMRVGIEKVLLVVSEYQIAPKSQSGECLGKEWITFDEAEPILASTTHITPKETLHVERLYDAGEHGVFHVGIQAYFKYPWYTRFLGGKTRTQRQTRTFYISRYLES